MKVMTNRRAARRHTRGVLGLALALAVPGAGFAAEPVTAEDERGKESVRTRDEEPSLTEEVDVRARADDMIGSATSAAEGVIGGADLEQRPKLRPGELLETVPGMIATQHSGGGKANQYFLRGFNLDHGTDFLARVEGMPLNMPTHGHGQGYTDMNILIPELVDRVHYRKGPYYADTGDFAAAGSADFTLVSRFDRPLVQLSGGSDGYARLLAAGTAPAGPGQLTGALEAYHYDGPWDEPDDYRRLNATGLYDWTRGKGDGRVFALGYRGRWDASDQIPLRAVEDGETGRFGQLDPDLGGFTNWVSLGARWSEASPRLAQRYRGFAAWYDFSLLSNFTYFLDDPVEGDEFEQRDQRWVAGGDATWQGALRLGAKPGGWRAGVEARFDRIDVALARTTDGAFRELVRGDDVDLLRAGGWGEVDMAFGPKARAQFALRVDGYGTRVTSSLPANSGSEREALLSPKANFAFGPWNDWELYLNLGYGYHSNDARGATIARDPVTGAGAAPVDPLVRAKGVDLGVRTAALRGLQSTLSLFALELDSELLFVGDAGITEASRPSRRTGIELANFWRALPWLAFDLDLAWTRARFTDDDPAGDRIPGALESVVTAGVTVSGWHGWAGSIRWRYFSGRPLIEDDSVRSASTSLINLRTEYAFSPEFAVVVEVFNLLDAQDSDIEYFYDSRLPGEPAEGIGDVHFHPMEPREWRLSLAWRP
ncbi:MAG: TonB-dependent receptor [Acidobacteria bacterium]|jgi:hypothetical protein|nr:TonB-dependent receptor [Acidobacteriota bacterium]